MINLSGRRFSLVQQVTTAFLVAPIGYTVLVAGTQQDFHLELVSERTILFREFHEVIPEVQTLATMLVHTLTHAGFTITAS